MWLGLGLTSLINSISATFDFPGWQLSQNTSALSKEIVGKAKDGHETYQKATMNIFHLWLFTRGNVTFSILN